MVRGVVCGIGVGLILCSGATAQGPQPLQLASREPAFYAIVGTHIERAEAGSFTALRARLVLRLHNATIPDALTAIQEQTSLRFTYKPSILPTGATVSLDANDITVAAALTQILLDADVDVEIAPYGQATLVARNRVADRQQPGDTIVVHGAVTDSSTHNPLSGVVVRVAGTNQAATSGADGTYTITHLAPGTYRLLFRRLGYAAGAIEVSAAVAGVYARDIALVAAPTVLDQVVTTVTGSQRLRSIGNTIVTINADSLMPNTPATTLSDVLNARAVGVQVINQGGYTGLSPSVFIRGIGSLSRSTQPLLYIDGVRVSNTVSTAPNLVGSESGGFNEISPNDIESIEVVKGPSAATLYGTDAANGVILITTKRATSGAPRWNVYSEGGAITVDPDLFGFNYTGWGHQAGGGITNSCTLVAVAAGSCTQDSVTHFNPLRVPSLTPVGTGNRGEGGVQVSGGSKTTRYFISGDYTSEVGPIKDAVRDQRILDSLVGPLAGSGSVQHPNSVSKFNARSNLTTPLGRDADVTFAAGYLAQTSHIPNTDVAYYAFGGPGYRDSFDGWSFGARPAYYFANIQSQDTRHMTGSVTAHWSPASWLSTRATVGTDVSSDGYRELLPTTAGPVSQNTGGNVFDLHGTTTLYSVDLGTTARLPLTAFLVANTSVGAQYNRTEIASATATATQLAIGGTSVSSGISAGSEVDSQSVVAGVYAEEQLAFNERLFVTGAVRVDGANDFGQKFSSAAYPKGSVSWIVSKEPFFPTWGWLSLVRLRAAYGESGTQPGLALTTFRTAPVTIDGVLQPGTFLQTMGNSQLQPERQKELEAGGDVDLFDSRLHMEFTYYSKRNANALYNVPLGPTLGDVGSIEENVGEIWNWGYEALLSAALVTGRSFSWDVSFNGSVNHNQVVTLGPFFQPTYGQYGAPSIVAGYPISSLFAQPYTYQDGNGNGIIEPNEVVISSKERYYAQTVPPIQTSVGTHFGFADNRVRIGALFDYRGGFDIPNQALGDQCLNGTAAASNIRTTPLAAQAACVAYASPPYDNRGLFSNGSFWRFRELSVTYTATDRLARAFRARSLSMTIAARNLALWTHFSGGDPETAPQTVGIPLQQLYSTGGGFPVAQYWLARINVGL